MCRARSTAGAWAESIEIGGKPEYQTLHSANELLLIRPRAGIARFQSSSRCGTHSFAVPPELPTSLSRPNSSLSLANFTVPPASRPASRCVWISWRKKSSDLTSHLFLPQVTFQISLFHLAHPRSLARSIPPSLPPSLPLGHGG